jgi:hypothetical protein
VRLCVCPCVCEWWMTNDLFLDDFCHIQWWMMLTGPRGASPLAVSFLKMQASIEAEKSRTIGCKSLCRESTNPLQQRKHKHKERKRQNDISKASRRNDGWKISLSRYIWLDRLLLFSSLLTRLVTTTHNWAPILLMDPWLDPLFGCTLWEWMHSVW